MFDRGAQMLRTSAGALRVGGWTLNSVDPEGLRYMASVSVWVHWFMVAVFCLMMVYRPLYGPPSYWLYWLLYVLFVAFYACVHYRLVSNRPITWRWILAGCMVDTVLMTATAAAGLGFNHYYIYLVYYPVLAGFAMFFTSFRLNMAFVTVVAASYIAVSLTVGDGMDLEARDEKALFVRIAVMYVVVAAVNLVFRFERARWRAAVERERVLRRERAELSQAIHDTTAQSAYMIGLGIDAAKRLAGDSNQELTARLEATSLLSKTAIWQLRHPIDLGGIFEGRELGRTLESHVSTFTQVTSVPADLVRHGVEPPLTVEARSLLFSIAHNALTNAFRHAGAGRVLVELDFWQGRVSLSVSDDGIGLPEGYEERGHGFANMEANAERLGGSLAVEPHGPDGGARVICVIPLGRNGS